MIVLPFSLPEPPIVAFKKEIDLIIGTEQVTRTRRMEAARINIVPGVAALIADRIGRVESRNKKPKPLVVFEGEDAQWKRRL